MKEEDAKLFAPVYEMLADCLDLPCKKNNYVSNRKTVRDHVAYINRTSISFWQLHIGNHGLHIQVRRADDGSNQRITTYYHQGSDSVLTVEEAKAKLLDHLTQIIDLDAIDQ